MLAFSQDRPGQGVSLSLRRAGDERWQRPRPRQAEFPKSVSRVLQIKIAASMTETLKIALLTQSALRILWESARWPEGWPHGPHANSGRRRGRGSGQWVPAAGRRPQGPSHTAEEGTRRGRHSGPPAVASAPRGPERPQLLRPDSLAFSPKTASPRLSSAQGATLGSICMSRETGGETHQVEAWLRARATCDFKHSVLGQRATCQVPTRHT